MIINVEGDIIAPDGNIYALWSFMGKMSILEYLYILAGFQKEMSPFPLQINMPCGKEYHYESEASIPSKSIPCRCGDETHYVFKYFHN